MKNIAAKLNKIMGECGYVQKTGTNDYHGYKYAEASNVVKTVHQSLVKNGIATTVTHELLRFEKVLNRSGKEEHLAIVKATIKFVDSETGESLETTGLGSGQDIGDKAVMKAETVAHKYALLQGLCIETGNDPEADSGVDERMGAEKQAQTKPQPEKVAQSEKVVQITSKANGKSPANENGQNACTRCKKALTEKEADYSSRYFGRSLCYKCQKADKEPENEFENASEEASEEEIATF